MAKLVVVINDEVAVDEMVVVIVIAIMVWVAVIVVAAIGGELPWMGKDYQRPYLQNMLQG